MKNLFTLILILILVSACKKSSDIQDTINSRELVSRNGCIFMANPIESGTVFTHYGPCTNPIHFQQSSIGISTDITTDAGDIESTELDSLSRY